MYSAVYAVQDEPPRLLPSRASTGAAHLHAQDEPPPGPSRPRAFTGAVRLIRTPRPRPPQHARSALSDLIRAHRAQIGLVWMEVLRLGDGDKRVKLGVDVTLALSALVPTLRLKGSQ